MGAQRSLAYKVLPLLPADLFCRMGSDQMRSMETKNRLFKNIVRCHGFGDWFSQLGQLNRISPILVHEFISPDILSTSPRLPASAFSRNQVARSHFGIWGGAVDCAPADLQLEMIHLYKECVLQRVPVIVHICRCLGVSCGSFRAGWPCAAPCSPQHAENKIQAWGFPLLQRVCSWNSGWMSVTAICCGLSFSAGRNKGKWWMLLPWSGLQEKWDKKKKNLQLFMYSWITQTDVLSKCNCINPYFKGKGQVMPKSHILQTLSFVCCLHKHSSASTAGMHK